MAVIFSQFVPYGEMTPLVAVIYNTDKIHTFLADSTGKAPTQLHDTVPDQYKFLFACLFSSFICFHVISEMTLTGSSFQHSNLAFFASC